MKKSERNKENKGCLFTFLFLILYIAVYSLFWTKIDTTFFDCPAIYEITDDQIITIQNHPDEWNHVKIEGIILKNNDYSLNVKDTFEYNGEKEIQISIADIVTQHHRDPEEIDFFYIDSIVNCNYKVRSLWPFLAEGLFCFWPVVLVLIVLAGVLIYYSFLNLLKKRLKCFN